MLALAIISFSRVRSYPITDRNGNTLESLFVGVAKATPFIQTLTPKPCQSAEPTLLGRLANMLSLTPVHALVNCQVTGCSGHYFANELYDCPPACEGPRYAQAYSDPMGQYDFGYKQDGTNGCPLSACAFCKTPTCVHR